MSQNIMGDSIQPCYQFGPYRLDTNRRVLRRGGALVPLAQKVFDILLLLVQNSSREISKQEFMEQIWPDSFVEESNLAQHIFVLRRALREERKEHQYIVTAPGRGYRFVARVEELGECGPGDQELVGTTGTFNYHRAASLAVLQFKPLTAGEKDALLGIGLADAIIMRLSNLRELSVRPTTSVLKYDDYRQDPLAAGRELNVDLVLDGLYQRDGDQLRVTAQLVRIEDGATLWAGKFDESFTNIFLVQDSISEQVGRLLTLKLGSNELRRLRRSPTDNTEAFQFYIRSRYFWNKRTVEGIKKGIEYSRRALEIDPAYAMAYVALADSYNVLAGYEGYPKVNFPKAKAAVLRALELDDSLAEAYASLAFINYRFEWDWASAEEKFRRAIELKPLYPTTHHWYGEYLALSGRFEESLASLQKALELDPVSLPINIYLALALFCAGRYEESEEQILQAIEMDRTFHLSYVFYGMIAMQQGRPDVALLNLQKALDIEPESAKARSALGYTYAVLGKNDEAQHVLDDLLRLKEKRYVPAYDIALICLHLKKRNLALDWLNKGLADKDMWLVWLKADPRFDVFRSDQRFAGVIQSIGLG